MSRQKQREKITHKPSVQDILYSMTNCSDWLELLLKEGKPSYQDFLNKLFEKALYRGLNQRVSITRIAKELGYTPIKVTKWITEMYEDIFTLNEEKPELFKQEGTRHELYFKHYDNYAALSLWLKTTPKEHERFSFYFLNAKLGFSTFYISQIHHHYEQCEHRVHIYLEGGFPNSYRSFILDKAQFYRQISLMDIHKKYDFEIDEELKSLYKSHT